MVTESESSRCALCTSSCFDCVNFHLCYLRRNVERTIQNSGGLLNVDGNKRPGQYIDIFRAIGSSCMSFEVIKQGNEKCL